MITRRAMMAGSATLGAAGALGAPALAFAPDRLNILMIVSDQQNAYADLPAALPLPHQARLRERGITFAQCHANTAPCGPARSVLYTGQHTQHTGVIANPNTAPFPALDPKVGTVGHMLRALGYETHYVGKWHLSLLPQAGDRSLTRPDLTAALEPFGFSSFNIDHDPHGLTWTGYREDRATAARAAALIDRLGERERGAAPWFLAVNFVNPHDIMFFDATGEQERTRALPGLVAPLAPAPDDPLYRTQWDVPLPASFSDDLSAKPSTQRDEMARLALIYGSIPREDKAAWRRFRSYYFNCICDMDRQLALVLDRLEASGQAGRTIIVFTSDHAERAGAHGLRQKGNNAYRENLNVPLVIVHPDVRSRAGATTQALISAVDIAPTLAEFAGANDIQERWPKLIGHACDAAVTGTGPSARDAAGILLDYGCIYGWDTDALARRLAAARAGEAGAEIHDSLENRALFRGMFDGRWKFVRYFAPADHHVPSDRATLVARNDLELYDLASDPHEMLNLASDPLHAARVEAMNARTNALIAAEIGDDFGAELPGPPERYRRS